MGALLIRHDERQTVCKLIESSAKEQIGKLIPVRIPTSTKINQAAIAQTSIQKIDRTSKVAREFRKLALWVTKELDIPTNHVDTENNQPAEQGGDDE